MQPVVSFELGELMCLHMNDCWSVKIFKAYKNKANINFKHHLFFLRHHLFLSVRYMFFVSLPAYTKLFFSFISFTYFWLGTFCNRFSTGVSMKGLCITSYALWWYRRHSKRYIEKSTKESLGIVNNNNKTNIFSLINFFFHFHWLFFLLIHLKPFLYSLFVSG